jgi:hypothetical protein
MYGDDFEQDLTEASIRDRLAARRHESGVYLASDPDA